MKKFFKQIFIGLFAMSLAGGAFAAGKGSADEAVAMAKKAVALIKSQGKEKAFEEFHKSDGKFVDRDLYVMAYDLNGVSLANGANLRMVGKNLSELKDADGNLIFKRMLETSAKGSGWVDYKWPNKVTNAIEAKSTYVERAGDVIVGVGIYK